MVGIGRKNVLCLLDDFSLEQVVFSPKIKRWIESLRKGKERAMLWQVNYALIFSWRVTATLFSLFVNRSLNQRFMDGDLEVAEMTVSEWLPEQMKENNGRVERVILICIRKQLGCISVEVVAGLKRLSWLGHIYQRNNARLPKKISGGWGVCQRKHCSTQENILWCG